MNCELINHQIEQLSKEDLTKPLDSEIEAHIQQCDACMNSYQRHLAYLKKMQQVQTPSLHPSTAAKMLREAREQNNATQKPNNGFLQGFIAASVLAVSVLGTVNLLDKPDAPLLVDNQSTEYIDKNVTIVIHSKNELHDAELDLILPQQVAIAGFDNIQQLTWPVDLKAGANTLELPIRVNMDKALEQPLSIMATLYHEESERNFEVDIELNKSS